MSWAPEPLREYLGKSHIESHGLNSCKKILEKKHKEKQPKLGGWSLWFVKTLRPFWPISPENAIGAKIHKFRSSERLFQKNKIYMTYIYIYTIYILVYVHVPHVFLPQGFVEPGWCFFSKKKDKETPNQLKKSSQTGPILQRIEPKIRHCALGSQPVMNQTESPWSLKESSNPTKSTCV